MDASAEECQTATQHKGTVMPISKAAPTLEKVALTADLKVRVCVGGGGRALYRHHRHIGRGRGDMHSMCITAANHLSTIQILACSSWPQSVDSYLVSISRQAMVQGCSVAFRRYRAGTQWVDRGFVVGTIATVGAAAHWVLTCWLCMPPQWRWPCPVSLQRWSCIVLQR